MNWYFSNSSYTVNVYISNIIYPQLEPRFDFEVLHKKGSVPEQMTCARCPPCIIVPACPGPFFSRYIMDKHLVLVIWRS